MVFPTSATVVFASPRALPDPDELAGRVVVLDLAFAADGLGTSFEQTTLRFIRGLGPRLAAWVDHHDHERHVDFRGDQRFLLATKAEHGACPEMITPALVREAGPIDTIVCHLDLDGLYAAAKWLLGGSEPYAGADQDAHAVDTRVGSPGPIGEMVDHALRAHFRDTALKHRIVRWLVGGLQDREHRAVIAQAATDFQAMARETERLARLYERRGRAVFVDAQRLARGPFDKTLLLLLGQAQAEVAVVREAGMVTAAAAYDSGVDFVRLLGLGGGMPTRVSLPERRLKELFEKLNG
ncbi:MAG: hypothetical protein RMK29_04625 [Myxococcales bacterium]|nr:hypothetical protein [Myxococcota bacterium]MDW8280974.1 hypothetical protein [Myxococcales bacterium]